MKKTKLNCLLLFATLFFTRADAQFFTNLKEPRAPGQRQASVIIDLKGVAVSQFKASIVYSTDSTAVANAFVISKRDPSKYFETQAVLRDAGNGKASATIIFPHRDKPAVSREKVYSGGAKVYYAWTRTNRPAGATSDLTINSPVGSFVMPRPLTIAYMGDSYASGEGAKGASWMHEPCHRSANSGGELAIRKLKQDKKEFEIDYINTTCSGATLLNFFAEAHRVEPGSTSTKQGIQVDLVDTWLSNKGYDGLDILLSDGGGNDIGFANVAAAALTPFANISPQLKADVQRELERLPETYNLFKNYLESKISVGRVVWFNYPNSLTGSDGLLCKQDFIRAANPLDCWGPLENQLSNNDWVYLRDNVFNKLNERVAQAANTHGWDFVNIANRSLRKGLCNCEGYFNTLGQSILSQGDKNGTMHPNATGFREIYRDALYSQLITSLNQFHTDYIADAKARAIEEAKRKAKAKAAFQAKITLLNQLKADQLQFIQRIELQKPAPALLQPKKQ